jgi:anti-sigma factor RsiW
MSCARIEPHLVSYMDGRASEAERREVDLHLLACAACRGRVEQMQQMWRVLDEAPRVEISPAFDARLRARIAEESRRRWFDWMLPQPRLAFALAALVALAVWLGAVQPLAITAQDVSRLDEQVIRMEAVMDDLEKLNVLDAAAETPQQQPEAQRKL